MVMTTAYLLILLQNDKTAYKTVNVLYVMVRSCNRKNLFEIKYFKLHDLYLLKGRSYCQRVNVL